VVFDCRTSELSFSPPFLLRFKSLVPLRQFMPSEFLSILHFGEFLTQHNLLLFSLLSAFIVLVLLDTSPSLLPPSKEHETKSERKTGNFFYDGPNCNKMINLFVKYTQFLSGEARCSVLSLSSAVCGKNR
jgi:hypothetical protein